MPTKRRNFDFTTTEARAIEQEAASLGVSVSALGRAWIEDFLDNGADLEKQEPTTLRRVQVLVNDETLAAATAKAQEEYGVNLIDILRLRISQL